MTANSCRPGAFCGVLTCCFSLIGNQVQAATHRSGADCFSCHADFKLAGTPLRPYGVGCKYHRGVSTFDYWTCVITRGKQLSNGFGSISLSGLENTTSGLRW